MNIAKDLDKYISLVDVELRAAINKKNIYNTKIYDAMEYSLFTGGKRLRPIFAIKSYELFDDDLDKILPFAIAIEMIHTYSLIHDDLPSMDNDDLRRGKPTNHKVFGEAMAILAGDGLLNFAFEIMSNYSLNNMGSLIENNRNIRAIREIANYSGCNGMIGGQVLDILSNYDKMDEESLIYMYSTKTAALIQASIISGAIIGGACEEELESLRDFGLNLGLAYQIKDDLLDFNEDKSINKFTYLRYHSLEDAERKVEILSQKAINALDLLENRNTESLKSLTKLLINREI
jgi:geranylgeranyl diphosphate synthase type II